MCVSRYLRNTHRDVTRCPYTTCYNYHHFYFTALTHIMKLFCGLSKFFLKFNLISPKKFLFFCESTPINLKTITWVHWVSHNLLECTLTSDLCVTVTNLITAYVLVHVVLKYEPNVARRPGEGRGTERTRPVEPVGTVRDRYRLPVFDRELWGHVPAGVEGVRGRPVVCVERLFDSHT